MPKPKIKSNIICLLILALISCRAFSQTKSFTLKTLGIKIGKLEAYRTSKNNFDAFVSHSTIDFVTIKADVKTEAIYQNGILIKAVVTSTINGKPYLSQTLWKKDHYQIDCHARDYNYSDSTLTTPIRWSAGKLYFEIPTKGDAVYAESYGVMGVLEETKKNTLKMTTPESKQIYYYNHDYSELLKIEVINDIKNFEMIPDN
ncbi:MAG: hypothetical protein K0S53_3008 [Bacteroidetes bacterium]|jgi:hypothetical protein|nr:hypothetical protein [Bacteroidota bacterium]MDF2452621.1 hypothetical protein [Bacteroidota bacterium]